MTKINLDIRGYMDFYQCENVYFKVRSLKHRELMTTEFAVFHIG